MSTITSGHSPSRPSGPDEAAPASADAAGDTLLRPGPGEAEAASALVARLDTLLGDARPGRLVGPGGDELQIPASVLDGLRRVAAAVAAGQAVTVAPHDLILTTQEAADLLHVSRPHLIKLLERGDLTYHRTSDDPRAHRRVLLRHVLDYRQHRRQDRRARLKELTQLSQDVPGGYR